MIVNDWLANDLTLPADLDLVSLVGSSLEWKIDKTRAFVVALLEDVNDHKAAESVNKVLLSVE